MKRLAYDSSGTGVGYGILRFALLQCNVIRFVLSEDSFEGLLCFPFENIEYSRKNNLSSDNLMIIWWNGRI